jgi:DNA-binding SARP family transcriptional activator/tetratricopeptide (TPR) repeat protein
MLRVSLLGEQVIADAATGVRCSSPRALALVGYLAAHAGAPQSRQRIAGLFWPDSGDAQALTNLRRELHHLRQSLGPEPALEVTARDLCWRDTETCEVDLRIFVQAREATLAADGAELLEHAARAVAAYRGDFLPGVYDDWAIEARAEFERQCADLCDRLAEERSRIGDHTGALEAARRRVRLQPLEEVGYRTLMRLQTDTGDRAGAVSTYHRCASTLERELGVIPDPATRRIFQRLIARPAPVVGPGPARLVGRGRELARLQALWRSAAAGRPGLALVSGGGGVGKTRLVNEIAGPARREGAVVASSQCFGSPGRLALAPVADWIRTPAVQAAVATLDDAWRAETDRLVPGAGGPQPAAGPRAMVDAWQRHRFFTGLSHALTAVRRPLLLVLDNMQWCDQETLSFLTFLLRFAAGHPVMVAGTLRDDTLGDGPALADWLIRMRATGLVSQLALAPLDAADTVRLAAAVSGHPPKDGDGELLQATTGGFPLYVIEAVRGSASPQEGDLGAVLRNRLDQATATAREVAGLAAAVGTDFTLDLLTEASDLEPGQVVEAVDELWRRRIIREFGDGYDFSHDLLRETAYAQVSPPKRWLLHRRVAQGLELLHPDDADTVSAQLAGQYARGGRPDRAVTYYRRAADVAAGLFAHTEAIRLHREALAIVHKQRPGRARDGQELAILEAMAAPLNAQHGYSSPELQRTLERSVALAEALGRTESLMTGLVSLFASRIVQGRIADAYRAVQRALGGLDPGSKLTGMAHFAIGGSALTFGRPAEGLRHLEVAARTTKDVMSLSVGTRPDVHSMAWAAHAHWLLGHEEATASYATDAVTLARKIGHPYSLAVALAYAAITCQLRDDRPGLRETVAELGELGDRYGFAYYPEWGRVLEGWSRGDESGVALVRRGIAGLRNQGAFVRMPYWLSLQAELATRTGEKEKARAILDAALADAWTREDYWWLPEVIRLRAAHDDPDRAVARLREAAGLATQQGSTALLRRCERDLAARGH